VTKEVHSGPLLRTHFRPPQPAPISAVRVDSDQNGHSQ
jgi:hypothetical protein